MVMVTDPQRYARRMIRARTMSSATLNGVAPVAAAQLNTSRVMAPMRDRSEDCGGLVVYGFLIEVDDAAGIRQIIRHKHDPPTPRRAAPP